MISSNNRMFCSYPSPLLLCKAKVGFSRREVDGKPSKRWGRNNIYNIANIKFLAPILDREILSVRIPCKNRNEPKSLTFIHTSRAGASPRPPEAPPDGGGTDLAQGSEGRQTHEEGGGRTYISLKH